MTHRQRTEGDTMSGAIRDRRPRTRAGLSIIYVLILLVVLIAFVGFAVDVGRIRLARSQLQTAADAAARAGAAGLPADKTIAYATDFAGKNQCLGAAVALDPSQAAPLASRDIVFGIWTSNDRTFHPL